MKKAIRLYINGTVQSVLFRQYVKENADKHSVLGYIRNLEDGRVEVFLQGESDSVDSLIALCKRGPEHAQIRSVEEKDERLQDFKEFKVLRL